MAFFFYVNEARAGKVVRLSVLWGLADVTVVMLSSIYTHSRLSDTLVFYEYYCC